ncbi:membrane protein [Basilea psittacipulmonis DSM 24701]|uniref:Membrane protein n=1 Tax=Basilea psittacipulmonis DSM 24701 TaxID=1072685 RepID=A0A077DCD7_9BURK|nr:membrane protein [Basilea psittacipulmonis DSM 24701]
MLLIIACILFGSGSLIVAVVKVGPYAIAFWRMFIAALIFIPIAFYFKKHFPQKNRTILYCSLSGICLSVDLALWHESVYAIGPGLSTLLNSLQVFFLAFIGYVCFHERLNRIQILSLFLAIIGVALIASPEFHINSNATWGFISGIVSGALFACSMTFVRKAHEVETVHVVPLMMILCLAGSLVILPFGLLFDAEKFFPHSYRDILLVISYGAVMQCLAWGTISYAISKVSLAITGLVMLGEPVAAIFFDILVFSKEITLLQGIGVILTLIAIYAGTMAKRIRHT